MKNYLQLWYVQLNDDLGNPQSADFGLSAAEGQGIADQFNASLPFPTWYVVGPTMMYFLMNKRQVSQLVKSTAIALDPFNNPTIFTTETTRARSFNVKDQYWQFDDADKSSVKANEIAEKRAEAPEADFSGAADLITNFFALCDVLVAELKADRKLDRLFRIRQINLILEVKKEVSEGLLSITDALQTLINEGFLR